ncbi:DUF4265 domain-containing protein [Cellulomonas sp. URHB0016]
MSLGHRRTPARSTQESPPEGPGAHVLFDLAVQDGWPPVSGERVWAYELGDDRFRIDNVPWFVRDIAVGDVVLAHAPDPGSHPKFVRVLEPSDHITIRIVCFRSGPLAGELQPVIDAFTPYGIEAEGVTQHGLVALDVPPTAPLELVHRRLLDGAADGSWEWEEGRITPAWEAATLP